PQTGCVLITPSGFTKSRVATENLCVVDLNGNLIRGNMRPSSETSMHVYVHRRVTAANAVLHTHSPAASAFAIAKRDIPCVSTEQGFAFGDNIPVVREYFCPGTKDPRKLESVVDALKKAKVVLLKSHGVLATGVDLEEALDNAVVVEDIAKSVLYSIIIGGFPEEMSAEEIREVREFRLKRYGQNVENS
nr:class II aldolase/adducin family protein [Candidatus Njordarchaeum guaymaensis]